MIKGCSMNNDPYGTAYREELRKKALQLENNKMWGMDRFDKQAVASPTPVINKNTIKGILFLVILPIWLPYKLITLPIRFLKRNK
jgi:hypothetical protein